MLEVLLASRSIREPQPVGGALASATVHVAIVVSIIVGGPSIVKSLRDDSTTDTRYLLPTDRGGSAAAERLTYMLSDGGQALDGAAAGAKPRPDKTGAFVLPQVAGSLIQIERATAVPNPAESTETVYSVVDVDSAAVRDPSSAAPAYPPVMMNKGIEGQAAMRFVVDTTGRIDMGTVELLQASNPEFVQAVREAMPRMRFHPAKMGAQVVRQLAEQLFKFEIRNKVAASNEAPAKRP